MPNTLAYVALLGWPLVALLFFSFMRASSAALLTLLVAQLFLPVRADIKIELLPTIDKAMIGNLALLLGCLLFANPLPRKPSTTTLLIATLCCFSPLVTGLFNGDGISIGDVYLPPVGLYDSISAIRDQIIALIPFFVGYRYFSSQTHVISFLRFLV